MGLDLQDQCLRSVRVARAEGTPPGPQAPRPPILSLQKVSKTWPLSHINTCPQRAISMAFPGEAEGASHSGKARSPAY